MHFFIFQMWLNKEVKIMVIIIIVIRILMSKFEFKDKGLVKLMVGVVKHVIINELRPVDYRDSNRFL
jgi:hypothetical protein